jgi:L-threonylcarbamoyladenylate synthase
MRLRVNLETPGEDVIRSAAEVIRRGGTIVYPTETIYGIGADATNPDAVRKVFAVKKRGDKKPVLVIVHSTDMLNRLVTTIPEAAYALMQEFWPGPLTLVFPASPDIPTEVTQGTGAIGVRIPSSIFCLRLVESCGCPVTSTSANISGQEQPRTIDDLERVLGDGIDLYVDGGTLSPSEPSTVVDVTSSRPFVIREGAIKRSDLIKVSPTII